MHVMLFIVMVFILIVVVRLGAVAFHLTGMEWTASWFQAVSCITSTGFTTRESELITATSERRRIAATLMILGSAGLVTLIAAIANSLRTVEHALRIPIVDVVVPPGWQPAVNFAVMLLATLLMLRLFTRTWLASGLTAGLARLARRGAFFRQMAYSELLIVGEGVGVAEVCVGSSFAPGHTLATLGLEDKNILVLALHRGSQARIRPPPSESILPADRLACFGDLTAIHTLMKQLST